VGGGTGGQSRCSFTPVGDLAEVHAVYAAVNAQQTPDPQNTAYVADELQNPTGPDRVVEASWSQVNGTNVQVLFTISCVDPPQQYSRWINVVADSAGNLVPQVRAIDLVPALRARVVRQLPTPLPRIGPADEDPDGWTYVRHRTFFWVDQGPGQWETVTGTAAAVTKAAYHPDIEGCHYPLPQLIGDGRQRRVLPRHCHHRLARLMVGVYR
jgi:hypothetical protein